MVYVAMTQRPELLIHNFNLSLFFYFLAIFACRDFPRLFVYMEMSIWFLPYFGTLKDRKLRFLPYHTKKISIKKIPA